jgi:hypothetical protein
MVPTRTPPMFMWPVYMSLILTTQYNEKTVTAYINYLTVSE